MADSDKVLAKFMVWLLMLFIGCACPILAQTVSQSQPNECRGDLSIRGLPIRTVKIETRGGWQPSLQLPLAPGDKFDFVKLSEARTIVHKALSNDPLRDALEASGLGSLSLFITTTCVTVHEASACGSINGAAGSSSCVDVIIRPFALRLDLVNIKGNTVPIPRSNRATFYSQVPAPLRALNPTFGIQHDRETGASPTASISTDLLSLPHNLRGQAPPDRNTKLKFDLQGSKSINQPFYDSSSSLSFLRRRTGEPLEDISLLADFSVSQQPLAEGKHFNNSVRVGGSFKLRPEISNLSSITIAGNYRWSAHRFFNRDNTLAEVTGEQSFEWRALVDGRAGDGTWRAGIWIDANTPEKRGFEPYGRLAFLGGYQSEIGKSEQTVGLEVVAGAGRSWGNVPAYARFYGGTGTSNFLYDAPDAVTMRAMPAGPLLRSFGRAQAGARNTKADIRGGTSYWHVNLNTTFPIPKLSCPLIPPIALADDAQGQNSTSNPCRIRKPPQGVKTLKDSLNGMVKTGQSFLEADIADKLIAEHVDEATAEAEAGIRAEKVFRKLTPAMRFLTEKANLYAVKPLFMLDVGRLNSSGIDDQRTRVAIGGGVQIVIAIAKFELGYVRAMRRLPSDPRGNFTARIVFQNLF